MFKRLLIGSFFLTCWLTKVAFGDANFLLDDAQDRDRLLTIVEAAEAEGTPITGVSGVTVPHHLLAADLIARGLAVARDNAYNRILLIGPDHFRVLKTPFGVTTEALETVFGPVEPSAQLTETLLAQPMVSDLGTAGNEHAIHAITPFVRHFFPDTPMTAMLASHRSLQGDWQAMVDLLGAHVGPETLIIQSTDYSHFLPMEHAVLRDQETLAAIVSEDRAAILELDQPGHLDSMAAQYIQTALQADMGQRPVVIANRNSVHYDPRTKDGVTTYVVVAYSDDPKATMDLSYPDQSILVFAGDTLLGRGVWPLLQDEARFERLTTRIASLTRNQPLVLNLEGVVLPERPAGLSVAQHFMHAEVALPFLSALNLSAVGIANNHSHDLGKMGYQNMRSLLIEAGQTPMAHGKVVDLGSVRVLPLTWKGGFHADHPTIQSPEDLDAFCQISAAPPLIVFAHWGEDYTDQPTDAERAYLETLSRCGVTAVIGAHSHQASDRVEFVRGGALQSIFSLGNFVFDQRGPTVSGALAELRVFENGTIALRSIPIPNLHEEQF